MNGKKLYEIRKKSGKTMRQISIESGVTEGQIRNIESGVTRNPRIETLAALAKVLSCEVIDFMD